MPDHPSISQSVLLLILTVIGSWAGAAPLHEASLIFPPEPFHNHSPSIVETPGGDLIACWFHGQGERKDNTVVILGSRLRKGSSEWSMPFLFADNKHLPDQNPTLFIDPQKRLWLFWVSSLDNEKRGHFLKYRISTDYEGEGAPKWDWQDALICFPREMVSTYTSAVDEMLDKGQIPEQHREEVERKKALVKEPLWHRFGWMPRQPPIMLSDTQMMLGLYSDVWNCSLMAFTEDGGATWGFSPPMLLSSLSNIQPSLVRKSNGAIVAFMRDAGMTRRAESSDGGMTWMEDPMDIRCSGSSVAALGLRSGRWLLAANDQDGRHQLTLYMSEDEGKTWNWKRELESFGKQQGSGQYPTLIQAADDSIHIVYSHEDHARYGEAMRMIKHVRFNEAWMTEVGR